MKNIILIVSLLLMGVSSRADILNSSDNKNVADKFDPMLKAALFQMKIIADTSSILLSDIDYVEDLELKTSLWIDNDVNRAKTTRHEITSLKGLEYFSSLRRLKWWEIGLIHWSVFLIFLELKNFVSWKLYKSTFRNWI